MTGIVTAVVLFFVLCYFGPGIAKWIDSKLEGDGGQDED